MHREDYSGPGPLKRTTSANKRTPSTTDNNNGTIMIIIMTITTEDRNHVHRYCHVTSIVWISSSIRIHEPSVNDFKLSALRSDVLTNWKYHSDEDLRMTRSGIRLRFFERQANNLKATNARNTNVIVSSTKAILVEDDGGPHLQGNPYYSDHDRTNDIAIAADGRMENTIPRELSAEQSCVIAKDNLGTELRSKCRIGYYFHTKIVIDRHRSS